MAIRSFQMSQLKQEGSRNGIPLFRAPDGSLVQQTGGGFATIEEAPSGGNQMGGINTGADSMTSYKPSLYQNPYAGLEMGRPGEDGMPARPEFASLVDPVTGRLKGPLNLGTEAIDPDNLQGFRQFEKFATGTGPSEYAQEAQKGLDLRAMLERDRASQEAASATARARSMAAMRGGIGAGAGNLATQGMREGLRSRQGIRQSQLLGTADLLSKDAFNRQNALQTFAGMGMDLGKMRLQTDQFNLQNALNEINTGRDFQMSKYDADAKKWAAEKKAEEQRAQAEQGCFHPETEVRMADGGVKQIQHIEIGDEVLDGGMVYAIYQQQFDGPLWDYEGVLVTGHHRVFEDGRFVRVDQSRLGKISHVRDSVVWDISTKRHSIVMRNSLFSDFARNDTAQIFHPREREISIGQVTAVS